MRKTAVAKAFKNWERAKEAHAKAKQSYGWAVERWEKLPDTIESEREWLTKAEADSAKVAHYRATGAYAQKAANTLKWAQEAVERNEFLLAEGKDAYLVNNSKRLATAEQEQRDTFTILSNYVQGYTRQNLKMSVEIWLSGGSHDEFTKLIINRTDAHPNGETVSVTDLTERILTSKARVTELDEKPRQVKAKRDGDAWITMGETVWQALKGVRGVAVFGNVAVDAIRLRQYIALIKNQCITVTPAKVEPDSDDQVRITFSGHVTHFKHHAWANPRKGVTELQFVA